MLTVPQETEGYARNTSQTRWKPTRNHPSDRRRRELQLARLLLSPEAQARVAQLNLRSTDTPRVVGRRPGQVAACREGVEQRVAPIRCGGP